MRCFYGIREVFMRNLKSKILSVLVSLVVMLGIFAGYREPVSADDLYFIKQPMGGSCDYSDPFTITWTLNQEPDWVNLEYKRGDDPTWYPGVDFHGSSYQIRYSMGVSSYRLVASKNNKRIYSDPFIIKWTGKDPYSFWTSPESTKLYKSQDYTITWTLGATPRYVKLLKYDTSGGYWTSEAELTRLKKYDIGFHGNYSETFKLFAAFDYGDVYSKTFTVTWIEDTFSVNVGSGTTVSNTAKAGDTVKVTADKSPTGKEFDKWVVTSGKITLANANAAETTFTMPYEDVSLHATYKDILYELAVDYDPSMIEVDGIASIKTSCYGDEYNFTVEPKDGYKIVSVKANGQALKASGSDYKVTQPAGKLTVSITAEPIVKNGWLQTGSKWMYFESGKHVTDWKKIGGAWYYFDLNGVMATGWKLVDCEWYCFETSGHLMTGWQQLDGDWYYFGSDGAMRSGWIRSGSDWYYLDSAGIMLTGWQLIDGDYYFLKNNGVMASSEWCGGYWLNSDGTWTYPYRASWKQDSRGWWYGDTSGWYAKNCKITIDGREYSFDKDGYWIA